MLSSALVVSLMGLETGVSEVLERVTQTTGAEFIQVSVLEEAEGSGRASLEEISQSLRRLPFVKQVVQVSQVIPDRPVRHALDDGNAFLSLFLTDGDPFSVLGVKPAQGRTFSKADLEPGARVCVVGAKIADMLQLTVGSTVDPDNLGWLAGFPRFKVIGILPEFDDSPPTDLPELPIKGTPVGFGEVLNYAVFSTSPDIARGKLIVGLYVEISPGDSETYLEQLREVLSGEVPSSTLFVGRGPSPGVIYETISQAHRQSFAAAAYMGYAVACLNVGNMLIALGRYERKETAIRRAIGASRLDVMKGLLIRGTLMSAVTIGAGAVLGFFAGPHIAAMVDEPFVPDVEQTLVISLVLLIVMVLFGTIPSYLAGEDDPVEGISERAPGWGERSRKSVPFLMALLAQVLAVVFIVAITGTGRMTEIRVNRLMELGGENGLSIGAYERFERSVLGIQREFPVPDDFRAVRELETELGFESAYFMSSVVNVASDRKVLGVPVTGVLGEALVVKGLRVKWGTAEVGLGNCVLGYETARQLFGSPQSALGKRVLIGDEVEAFVSGVLEPVPKGIVSKLVEPDETLYMPLEEARRVRGFEITPKGAEIFLRFESEGALRTGKERVVSVLPTENGVVAYKVTQPFKVLQEYRDFKAKTGQIFSLFGSMALIGSLIGIFNYVIVDVLNRRQEIGVLRSVGASKFEIGREVLREALTIAGMGGIAAFVTSAVILILMGNPLPLLEWVKLFGVALGISAAVGVLSGLIPAIIASNQDPVECLRME